MKKVLAAATMLMSLSAFGDEAIESKNFYLKLEGGISKFNRINDKILRNKLKAKPNAILGLGFGGYVNERVRTDLTVNYNISPVLKNTRSENILQAFSTDVSKKLGERLVGNLNNIDLTKLGAIPQVIPLYGAALKSVLDSLISNPKSVQSIAQEVSQVLNQLMQRRNVPAQNVALVNNNLATILNNLKNNPVTAPIHTILTTDLDKISIKTTVNRKSKVGSTMIGGYVNLVEFNNVQLFAGAGVGMSLIREKISVTSNLIAADKVIPVLNETSSAKIAKNLAYSLTLGVSTKVANNVNAELSYNYKDFGKSKSVKYQGIEVGKTAYRSHSVLAGIRFDL